MDLQHPRQTVIAEALIALANHSDLLHSLEGRTEHQALGDALRTQHSLRRALMLNLLTHTSEKDFFRVWSAVPHGCLTTYDDAFYWVEQWEQLADVPAALARLLVSITPPTDPELQTRLAEACRAHPTLHRSPKDGPQPQNPGKTPPPLPTRTASTARHDYAKHLPPSTPPLPRPSGTLGAPPSTR